MQGIDDRAIMANYKNKLLEIAAQLCKWALESRRGGWSTHQVDPQRRLADEIDDTIADNDY